MPLSAPSTVALFQAAPNNSNAFLSTLHSPLFQAAPHSMAFLPVPRGSELAGGSNHDDYSSSVVRVWQ